MDCREMACKSKRYGSPTKTDTIEISQELHIMNAGVLIHVYMSFMKLN